MAEVEFPGIADGYRKETVIDNNRDGNALNGDGSCAVSNIQNSVLRISHLNRLDALTSSQDHSVARITITLPYTCCGKILIHTVSRLLIFVIQSAIYF